MKWIIVMMTFGTPHPLNDTYVFSNQTGCEMAVHNINLRVGPQVADLMKLQCMSVSR